MAKTFICYVPALKKKAFVFISYDDNVVVRFMDYDDGCLLLTATLLLPTGRKDTAYINNQSYPWLYKFLIVNNIGSPTYHSLCKDGKSYEEFKF